MSSTCQRQFTNESTTKNHFYLNLKHRLLLNYNVTLSTKSYVRIIHDFIWVVVTVTSNSELLEQNKNTNSNTTALVEHLKSGRFDLQNTEILDVQPNLLKNFF